MPSEERYPHPGPRSTRELSPARLALLGLLQSIHFGRIEGLVVRHGEPVLDPRPTIIREHKFAGENRPRPESCLADYELKLQFRDLMQLLDRIGNGQIAVLTIKHGLPFHAELEG